MKVLLVNGSAREKGCTHTALTEVAKALNDTEISTEIFFLGTDAVRDCIGCQSCRKTGKCVFDDDMVNGFVEKAKTADGFVFGSPVYYAHPSGRLLCFMNRVFYSAGGIFAHKPAAAVVSARRAGTTAAIDVINKYFQIAGMPVVSSNYWNMVHGNTPDDVRRDAEGLQIMHLLGQNMAWMLKSFDKARKNGVLPPETPEKIKTNFIRD